MVFKIYGNQLSLHSFAITEGEVAAGKKVTIPLNMAAHTGDMPQIEG